MANHKALNKIDWVKSQLEKELKTLSEGSISYYKTDHLVKKLEEAKKDLHRGGWLRGLISRYTWLHPFAIVLLFMLINLVDTNIKLNEEKIQSIRLRDRVYVDIITETNTEEQDTTAHD